MSRKQQICRSPSTLMPTRPPPPNPTSVRYTDTSFVNFVGVVRACVTPSASLVFLISISNSQLSHTHTLSPSFAHQASNSRRYLLRVHISPAFGTLDLMLKVTVIP
ncbi:hypothetical protein L2E82_19691 [Cichorium intybus]|uniref:Uncharacterized protein n=1 Tax=Cichorium intybus TaxID=13427 RepID=A0ACB9FCI5_CICIN|nr:hypothetical protein L2E82_19691 [Cichorium intybus]